MSSHFGDSRNVNLAELLGEGEELLAAATIAVNSEGEYAMNIADLDGAPITMTPTQKAHALRILATAVEAEAIFNAFEEDPTTRPAVEPAAPRNPVGYALLVTVAGTTSVYLSEDASGELTAPFETPEKAIAWLDAHPGERRPDAVVSAVALVPLEEIREAGHA